MLVSHQFPAKENVHKQLERGSWPLRFTSSRQTEQLFSSFSIILYPFCICPKGLFCIRRSTTIFIPKLFCLHGWEIEMFSPAVLVKHSTACFLFDICWCAYLMNKARLEQSYAEGWPQSGTYGKGCTARNSSRHVGVFNGEWSNLRFLMMIRGGNWLRFTVSLTAETEEGENRIKASKLSVCGYAGLFVCAQVWDRKRERETHDV